MNAKFFAIVCISLMLLFAWLCRTIDKTQKAKAQAQAQAERERREAFEELERASIECEKRQKRDAIQRQIIHCETQRNDLLLLGREKMTLRQRIALDDKTFKLDEKISQLYDKLEILQ